MNGLVAPRPILGRREAKTAHNGWKRRDYCLAGPVAMAHRTNITESHPRCGNINPLLSCPGVPWIRANLSLLSENLRRH
jgi:hypothetical protein